MENHMAELPVIAAIQMNSTPDVAENLATAKRLLQEAAGAGAALAALPENFACMGAKDTDKLAFTEADGSGPIQDFLATAAYELGLWIVAGTVPLAVPGDTGRVYAASLVYGTDGMRVARYDKIHLFDVDVIAAGATQGTERYRESNTIAFGAPAAVVVDTPVGKLGLSVCYDLRFPELYRALAAAGAEILCVPAAFTARTGAAHWETLLRARAIENQVYVIAPGECGTHAGGRQTWGHSMIVGPWGDVLACRADGEGVASAPISVPALHALRRNFPSLSQRRFGL
jgi:deaminated glutathione amidase